MNRFPQRGDTLQLTPSRGRGQVRLDPFCLFSMLGHPASEKHTGSWKSQVHVSRHSAITINPACLQLGKRRQEACAVPALVLVPHVSDVTRQDDALTL